MKSARRELWDINLPFKHYFICLFLNHNFKVLALEMLSFISIIQLLVMLIKPCNAAPLLLMPRAITYIDTNSKIIHQVQFKNPKIPFLL